MSDEQRSVGAQLVRAREDAAMTTAQVSEATRLRRTIVEALERDDLRPSGGIAYARGHIKSIAAVLGVDPGPLLDALGAPSVAQTSPHPADGPRTETAPATLGDRFGESRAAAAAAERRGPNWTAVMAVALALVLGVGGYQLVRGASDSVNPPLAVPLPTASGTAPTAPVAPPPPDATPPTQSATPGRTGDAIAQAETVNVVLTVTGSPSWVMAETPKGTLFEGTLTTGERKTFKDRKKIKFIFGNAGGVSLRVNGIDIGSPGNAGQVVRTSFGPNDPDSSRA